MTAVAATRLVAARTRADVAKRRGERLHSAGARSRTTRRAAARVGPGRRTNQGRIHESTLASHPRGRAGDRISALRKRIRANRGAPVRMRIQTAVPSASIYFELLKRMGDRIDRMSAGRVKMEILPDGAIVPAFEILDAVDKGIVEGGYAWTHYWSGKNPAAGLFSNPMAGAGVGLDQLSHVAWIFEGGGYDLYRKLYSGRAEGQRRADLRAADGAGSARLVQDADQQHRRLQEDEVPRAAGHHRRDLQGDGRRRRRAAGRRDRAGGAARRDRRRRMDRPGRRPEPRPADRVEALLPAGPAPVDRHRRDPDQQDGLGQAARRT